MTITRQISEGSDMMSPSMGSSSRRGLRNEQIKKPLVDSFHEEAFPAEETIESNLIEDDDIPNTEQVIVEDPRSPKPLRSFEPNAMRRCSERSAAHSRFNSCLQSDPVISTEQLMQMLTGKRSTEAVKKVDGFVVINGESFRIANEAHQQQPSKRIMNKYQTPSNRHQLSQNPFVSENRRNDDLLEMTPSLSQHQLILDPPSDLHLPMNEQRSTDEPILLQKKRRINQQQEKQVGIGNQLQMTDKMATMLSKMPKSTRAESHNLQRHATIFNQTMAIGQSITKQILPKISQTISNGSLQASVPSDSNECSPERPQFDREWAKRSFKRYSFDEIQEYDKDSQTDREGTERDKKNNNKKLTFMPPYLDLQVSDSEEKQDPSTAVKAKAEPAFKIKAEPAFEIKAELEAPQSAQSVAESPLPSVEGLQPQKRKKKKKNLKIEVETTNDDTAKNFLTEKKSNPFHIETAQVDNQAEKIPSCKNTDETQSKSQTQNDGEVAQISPDVTHDKAIEETAGTKILGKKKKRKLNINVGNSSLEPEKSNNNTTETFLKFLPETSPKDQKQLATQNDYTQLSRRSSVLMMKKQSTYMDDLLSQLESQVNPRLKKKAKPGFMLNTIEEKYQNKLGASRRNEALQPISHGELEQEFLKGLQKRNNSDSIRHKDELKTKKVILRELQDLKESLFYQQNEERSEIDIAFLHASPIFIEGRQEGKTSLVALKFQKEKSAIIEAINQSDQNVRFRQSVATKEKFIDIIRKRPTCLHISCHGFDQGDTSMKVVEEDDQRNLLFETENGDGRLISQRELNKILKQAMTKIKLVFVAACMSDFVGKIFQQCDVPHVICSEQGKTILDEAAISFSKFFYTKLFSGQAVCKAFQLAQQEVAVKFSENEANRFQLMISMGQFKHSVKRCHTHWPTKNVGQLECLSEHIKFKHLRAKITNFIPREIEFYKLVCFIQDEHQLAHYRGLPGVGKTYMVRKVLTYLSERKYFSAGLLYFPLNDSKSVQQFLITLRDKAMSFFKLSNAERFDLCMTINSEMQILDFLVEFFEDKALLEYELLKQKNFSTSKNKNRRFLLVLDNCEGLIDNNGEEFGHLLRFFLDKCKMLKIVVVSRNQLCMSDEGEEIDPLILPQLGSKQAVQFFLDVLEHGKQSIKIDEIVELILGWQLYPIQKVFRDIDGAQSLSLSNIHLDSISLQEKAELTKVVEKSLNSPDSKSKLVEILSYHDLFRLLQGNPTSVRRAANVYMNQLLQVETETLLGLYNRIKQNDFIESEQSRIDDTRPKPRLNNESLQATTKLAIDMLPSEDSKSLLYFIGLLPAGVTVHQLKEMWNKIKVKSDLDILKKYNLVEKTDSMRDADRYELNPVLYQFIGQDINILSQRKFMLKIISYYKSLLIKIYQKIAVQKIDGNLETMQTAMSPIRSNSPDKCSSFRGNTDFSQLSHLKSGLQKKEAKWFAFSSINSSQHWQWKNPGIEASITSQILQELPNLNRCMEYIVESQNLQRDSFNSNGAQNFNDTGNFNRSLRASSAISNKSVLMSTLQRKNKRLAFKQKKSCTEESLSYTPLDQRQSVESTAGGISPISKVIDANRVESSSSFGMQVKGIQNKQKNTDRRKTVLVQNLDVIDELQEQLNATKTSMQSDESPDIQQIKMQNLVPRKTQSIEMQKKNSVPFSISLGPLDSDQDSKMINILQIAQRQVQEVLQAKTEFLNLNKSIGKCDKFIQTLKLKQKNTFISGRNLDERAKNDRTIMENDDDSDDEELFERSKSVIETPTLRQNSFLQKIMEIKQSSNDKDKCHRHNTQKNLLEKKQSNIFVSQLNLDSDRKFIGTEQSDGLGDVRLGSDIDEDDFDSDSAKLNQQPLRTSELSNADRFNHKNEINQSSDDPVAAMMKQFNPDDDVLNSGRSKSNEMHKGFQQDRRLTLQMLRRKSANCNKNKSSIDQSKSDDVQAAATMMPSLADRMRFALKNKVQKQREELDQQASFTIRKSFHAKHNSPKAEKHVAMLNNPINQKVEEIKSSPALSVCATGPSPISQKSSAPEYKDQMSLQGEFIIYTTVNALLVDNVNFAYQVSQTDFSCTANSVLFLGNLNRFKALASEQIFLRYYDANEVETHDLLSNLIEAVRAAKEAHRLYGGDKSGRNRNEYGLGLQCFHIGYLYQKYAAKLSEVNTIEAHEDICGGNTEADFKRMARDYLLDAYNHFSIRAHLKGMYMAKQYEAELYESFGDNTSYQNRLLQVQRHRSDYESYIETHGHRYSCHIPRLHGDVFSLLTEIVKDNESKDLFRFPNNSHRQQEKSKKQYRRQNTE